MASMKLDARTIAALKVQSRTQFYDEVLPGFLLRISETGTKTWCVEYRFGGRQRKFKIGRYPIVSLADARDKAREILGQVATGIDPAEQRNKNRQAETVNELCEQYIKWAAIKKTSWKDDQSRLDKYFRSRYGSVKANSIKKSDVMAVLDELSKHGHKVEPNRALKVIKRVYSWGIEREIVLSNPCIGIKNPVKELPKDRVLSASEIKKLWDFFEKENNVDWAGTKKDKIKIISIFKLMLLTGQRGEIVKSMEWSEVDLQGRHWTVPKEKMKMLNPHRLTLGDMALKILKELKLTTGRGKYVFPSPSVESSHIGNIQKAAERIRDGVSFVFCAHDLRRTAASHMTAMGVPRLVVKKILGHACNDITAVYDLYQYDFEKARALNIWNDRLVDILNGKTDFSSKEDQMVWLRVSSPF